MTSARRLRPLPAAALAAALLVCHAAAGSAAAQERSSLRLTGPDGGASRTVDVAAHRGYAAVPVAALRALGWSLQAEGPDGVRATAGEAVLELRAGEPFFRWDGELLQLVDEPYRFGDGLWVPLQLLVDFLPARLRGAYAFSARPPTLTVLDPALWVASTPAASSLAGAGGARTQGAQEPPRRVAEGAPGQEPRGGAARPEPRRESALAVDPGPRVVIIDPGHGGRDPGALGPGGVREKDVALALGLALADELRSRAGLEVHLTRDDDRLVPIWQRGQWATDVKGSRYGIFLSLHANALPSRRDARGFETYFLSEARTDHERRVAALENAPLRLESQDVLADDPDLDFILKELRNFDHAHWSELLAQLVQERLAPIHPGPNRGVKQAPLAVITNALMPAVLVEVGFITNREEARLLARPSFHRDAARVLADAVVAFFERYPPGAAAATGGEDR